VQRIRSHEDQRQVHLRLTPSGRSLRRRVKKMLDRVIDELSMAPEDVSQLRDRLHAFVNILEPIIEARATSCVAA
jgi:MarR family transcriptional regulator, organic hydroperoxide resistance regulator